MNRRVLLSCLALTWAACGDGTPGLPNTPLEVTVDSGVTSSVSTGVAVREGDDWVAYVDGRASCPYVPPTPTVGDVEVHIRFPAGQAGECELGPTGAACTARVFSLGGEPGQLVTDVRVLSEGTLSVDSLTETTATLRVSGATVSGSASARGALTLTLCN